MSLQVKTECLEITGLESVINLGEVQGSERPVNAGLLQ